MIAPNPDYPHASDRLQTQILVIGSGAGGAVGASTLARKGLEVLVLEEGPHRRPLDHSPYIHEAMADLWRSGGIKPILGKPRIAFAEGRCVGGSTEINSALYHRTPDDVLRRWQDTYGLDECSPIALRKHFRRIELATNVSYGSPVQPAEIPLRRGADGLGWRWQEVGRMHKGCVNTNYCGSGCPTGGKQSMSVTYIREGLSAGMRLSPNCRAVRLVTQKDRVTGVDAVAEMDGRRRKIHVEAEHVFVCGGPIQTPALLRRSGIRRNVGDNLQLHPTVKVAAMFPETLDAHEHALPACQVHQFAPDIRFGASLFSPAFLSLALGDNWSRDADAMRRWRQMGLYYAAIRCSGRGRVRTLPGWGDGIIALYRLTDEDRHNLSVGLGRLCELLFVGGAEAVYLPIPDAPPLRNRGECRLLMEGLVPLNRASLIAIHAFSTCPMGEDRSRCAVDSYGRVHGYENLHVADASMLPDSPGVNPQGTIMAFALRNAEHFVQTVAGV